MAILKFRVFLEEDDTVYRDILIKHNQLFYDLHQTILLAYEFDSKHQATFYRSNENWLKGRAISLEEYDMEYRVAPLMMLETTIGSEISDPNQKFLYVYDFEKNWTFLIQLIGVSKEENAKLTYPSISRKEGIGPSQYGIKSILGDRFADVEEKYDLNSLGDGFGDEGEDENTSDDEAAEDDGIQDDTAF